MCKTFSWKRNRVRGSENKRGHKKTSEKQKEGKTTTKKKTQQYTQIQWKTFKQVISSKRSEKLRKNQICKRCKKVEQTQRDNKLPTKREKTARKKEKKKKEKWYLRRNNEKKKENKDVKKRYFAERNNFQFQNSPNSEINSIEMTNQGTKGISKKHQK